MSEHTKGPWHIEKITNRQRSGFNAAIHSATCDVAEVYGWEDAENAANAHLIAAAPDLLAACEAALAASERMWGKCNESNSKTGQLHAKLRDVIAKAKGPPHA